MTSLLTQEDVKLYIFEAIQTILAIKEERVTGYRLAKILNVPYATIFDYTKQGMPHTKEKKVIYYRLNKVINWMKEHNKRGGSF